MSMLVFVKTQESNSSHFHCLHLSPQKVHNHYILAKYVIQSFKSIKTQAALHSGTFSYQYYGVIKLNYNEDYKTF